MPQHISPPLIALTLALTLPQVGCRNLAIQPRLAFDRNVIYQKYTILATTTAYGAVPAYAVLAEFLTDNKSGPSVELPRTDTVTVNGQALKIALSDDDATTYRADLTGAPTAFALVWTLHDGTVYTNNVTSLATELKVEAPPTTVSRTQPLLLSLTKPAVGDLQTVIVQASGKAVAGQISTSLSPAVVYTAASLTTLDSGAATLSVTATTATPATAVGNAGGEVDLSQAVSYAVSLSD